VEGGTCRSAGPPPERGRAAIKPPVQSTTAALILCDVAREDASVVIEDLRALNLHREGSIAMELVDTAISDAAELAERVAAGAPSDAVIWEEVTERTSESATLSAGFAIFMVLASCIAAVGILLDSAILIVGAMVVGPEFGPIAGFCVAAVQRRPSLAGRSFAALAVGFPLGIAAVFVEVVVFKATGIAPESFSAQDHSLSTTIASPDFLAGFVAFCAVVAGMLSLTTAKSGACRRSDLGHDDSRRLQCRRRSCIRRQRELPRFAGAARSQRRRAARRRDADPAGPALRLPAPAARAPPPAGRHRQPGAAAQLARGPRRSIPAASGKGPA
jgi:uncharacterized hydrophobic protein (TIGR00271 family)